MSGDKASIQIRHEYWYTWGRIARVEAANASAARKSFGSTSDSADQSTALDEEMRAGLVAICAAAFSMETLARFLTPMAVPQAIQDAWKATKKRRAAGHERRLRDTMKACVALPSGDVDRLVNQFQPVISKRGDAVHHLSEFEDPVAHPVAGHGSSAAVLYGSESVQEAIDAMQDLYRALLDHPSQRAAVWVQQQTVALTDLAGR